MSNPTDVYQCQLDELGQKRAKSELGEIDTDRMAAVQALRDWVLAQSQWLKSPTDTQFLLGFLRHRKFSQKAAKERLIQYWKIRTEMTDWFSKVDPKSPKLAAVIRQGMFLPLPKRDKDGSMVLFIRKVSLKGDLDMQFSSSGAMLDLALRHDMTQVCGLKVICDFTGVTVEHVMKLADGVFKKMTQSYMRAYPLRIGTSDYYNMGTVLDLFFSVTKPLIPKKINERGDTTIYVLPGKTMPRELTRTHKSLKTVYESVDMSILPRDYLPDDYSGPCSGTHQEMLEEYIKVLESDDAREYLMHLSSGQFYCDEKQKPSEAVPTESFRSLQL